MDKKRLQTCRAKTVRLLIDDTYFSKLTVSDLFTNNRDKAVQLSQKRVNYLSQLENLESEWLEAVDIYETAVKNN